MMEKIALRAEKEAENAEVDAFQVFSDWHFYPITAVPIGTYPGTR